MRAFIHRLKNRMASGRAILFVLSATTSIALAVSACGDSNSNPSAPTGGGGSTTPQETPAAFIVTIPANAAGMGTQAYSPSPMTVPVGTTVTWANRDTIPHTATATDGSFDSGSMAPGQTFSHRFDTAGSFQYYCTIHGFQSMNGTIVVTAGGTTSSPSPSASPSGGAGGTAGAGGQGY